MDRDARRSQIVDVTTRLIAERGFWGITLRDVALACGITEAGVLHYVGSKDGLLVAVLEHRDSSDNFALAQELGVAVSVIKDGPTPFGLIELCDATVKRNSGQPEIVRLYAVLQSESLFEGHPAHDYFRDRERRAMDLFARAASRDYVPDELRTEIARETMAAMDGLQLRWLHSGGTIDLVQQWKAFASRLFRDLGKNMS